MTYSLKTVSAYLGVPPDTVRKWENRYDGLVDPVRLANRYRRYSERDLQRLLAFAEARRGGLPGLDSVRVAAKAAPAGGVSHPLAEKALRRLERFDGPGTLALFERSLKGRTVTEAFSQLWLPVLAELGARAHSGPAVGISVEHFASAFLKEKVLAELAAKRRSRRDEIALCAPQGDRHELGMMLAACALEEAGAGALYLGPDLPLESLEAALDKVRLRALALSLTARRPRRELKAMLSGLKARFPAVRLFVCGQESLRHANLVRDLGAVFIGTDLARGTKRIVAELRGAPLP